MQINIDNLEEDMQGIIDDRLNNILEQTLQVQPDPDIIKVQTGYNRWNEAIYTNLVNQIQGPVFGQLPIKESFNEQLNAQLQQRNQQLVLSQNITNYAKSNIKNSCLEQQKIPCLDQIVKNSSNKLIDGQKQASEIKQSTNEEQLSQLQNQTQNRQRIHSFMEINRILDEDVSFVDYLDNEPEQKVDETKLQKLQEEQTINQIKDYNYANIPNNLQIQDINQKMNESKCKQNQQKLDKEQIDQQKNYLKVSPQFIQKLHLPLNTCQDNFQQMNTLDKLKSTLEEDNIVQVSLANKRVQANDPKHDIQIQREIIPKARDLLIPKPEVKKLQQSQGLTQQILNEKESVINMADPTLEDLSNIISERINQYDLPEYIDEDNMELNCKKSIDAFKKYFNEKYIQIQAAIPNSNSDKGSSNNSAISGVQNKNVNNQPQQLHISNVINPFIENRINQYQREQKFTIVEKNYQDKEIQMEPELILEETKWPSDWILEDLNYLRKANENSYVLLENVPYSQQIHQNVKEKFENKLFELLNRVMYPNQAERTKEEALADLQKEIQNDFKNWQGKYVDGRLKLSLIKVFLEDYKNLAREYQYQQLINKMVQLDNIEAYRIKQYIDQKQRYIKDFDRGTKKLRNYNYIDEQQVEKKNIDILTRMLKRKLDKNKNHL